MRKGAPSWAPVLVLTLLVAAARLTYLAFFCPYTLVEDEAWYWEWSRRLEWSYSTKGPGIAWLIAASVAVSRMAGQEVSEFVIRAPAVISGAAQMIAVAGLTRDTLRSGRAMMVAAAMVALVPIFQFTSLLMTIDGPFFAAWALAAWAGWRALCGGSRWAWLGLGGALAAGFLFKYTILLLVPGILLFALLHRRSLQPAAGRRPWMAGGAVLASLGLLPVLVWNARHDWPTARHLLGHLGVAGGDVPTVHSAAQGWNYNPAWTLEFIVVQAGVVGPLVVLMVWGVCATLRRRDEGRVDRMYLAMCAMPIMVFYLGVTLLTRVQGNWPAAGYLTLFPLAAWVVADGGWRWARWWWGAGIAMGVLVAVISLRLDVIAESGPAKWIGEQAQRAGVIGKNRPLIPLGRLMGADAMAAEVQAIVEGIKAETGKQAFVAAQHYGRASLLAFYLPGRPVVYGAGAKTGGRLTQYDLWEQTSLDRMDVLGGRPAVLLGGSADTWQRAFGRIVEYGRLKSETKADRLTFIGYDYLGWGHEWERGGDEP